MSCDTRRKFGKHGRSVTVGRGVAGSSTNPSFLNAFPTFQTKEKRESVYVNLLRVVTCNGSACLGSWDNPVTWFQSFDVKRYLQARQWQDKQENFCLHKYAVTVLGCALPANFHPPFLLNFSFPHCTAFLLSFDWSVCSDKVFITIRTNRKLTLAYTFFVTHVQYFQYSFTELRFQLFVFS